MLIFVVLVLSLMSYFVGARAVIQGLYKPNIYSRVIWSLLAINGLVGLIFLHGEKGVVVLSGAQTLGSLLILMLSFKYSVLEFGVVEVIASLLLLVSGAVWLLADSPLLNLLIGLTAHFIAGLPTLSRVLRRPNSENTMFWGYFAIASFLSLVFVSEFSVNQVIFPGYFLVYNSLMVGLSLKKKQ